MVKSKKKTNDYFALIGLVLYFHFGHKCVHLVLSAFNLFSVPAMYCLSSILLGLAAYPIFFRGTDIIWSQNQKEWTFRQWVPLVLIYSIVTFVVTSLILGQTG